MTEDPEAATPDDFVEFISSPVNAGAVHQTKEILQITSKTLLASKLDAQAAFYKNNIEKMRSCIEQLEKRMIRRIEAKTRAEHDEKERSAFAKKHKTVLLHPTDETCDSSLLRCDDTFGLLKAVGEVQQKITWQQKQLAELAKVSFPA